jgi:hypothetical protein
LELHLKNRVFKKKKSFWAKTLFLSFCQKCFLAIFRLLEHLKMLLIFFYQTSTFFFKRAFWVLKARLDLSNVIPDSKMVMYIDIKGMLSGGKFFFFF